MYKIVALTGEAGSGKDYILKEFLKQNPDYHKIINCTTRPIREGEREGVNYYYLSDEDFFRYSIDGEMLEEAYFNGWGYGTLEQSLSPTQINVGVFNPKAIQQLIDNENCEVLVIYVRARDKTRLLRQLEREDDPNIAEIIRRYSTDKQDFSKLTFDYIDLHNDTILDTTVNLMALKAWVEGKFALGQN